MDARLILRTVIALTALLLAALFSGGSAAAVPSEHPAAGGAGRHAVVPGSIFASFQINHRAVQCRIAHGVQDGTAIQMFMDSSSVDGYDVDGNTVTATGAMVSTTILVRAATASLSRRRCRTRRSAPTTGHPVPMQTTSS